MFNGEGLLLLLVVWALGLGVAWFFGRRLLSVVRGDRAGRRREDAGVGSRMP